MKTSSIVSSLLTASLASAIAVERRQLFGLGSNNGAVSASVPGASICVDILGNGCAKTTSTAKAATQVAATQAVTVQAQAQTTAAVAANVNTAATIGAGISGAISIAGNGVSIGAGISPTVGVGASTSTSVAAAATSPAVAYNAQADWTLNSYTGFYGQGCPSGHGPSAVFPNTLLLTSIKNPLQILDGYSYETTPNDVCTQMTFIIPASTTGYKTCTFNVQVPSYYELSKETLSYDGPGDFTFEGVANGIAPFNFNIPLIDWYGTVPGLSKVAGSIACNIPAGIPTTVVGRLCSKDTTVKYAHTADTCKVGIFLQPFN